MRSLLVTLLALVCLAPAAQVVAQDAGRERPNVVLVITDDLGWADVGAYGSPDVRTPNIDGLARDGIRLTDFYANGTTCSPTRAGLLSGRYQQRYGLEAPLPTDPARAGDRGLRATGYSLPQLLKNRGYATALVGKWHLGYKPEHSPNAHGFDYFFGFKSGYHDYYQHTDGDGKPDLWENDRPIERRGYTTDLVTDRAVAFIEQHSREPFFIDIAYNAPHWPYQVPGKPSVAPNNGHHVLPQDADPSSRDDYVAMVEHLDAGVGKVLATLERLGVAKDTVVVFTNDNGGEWLSSMEPLTGRKWTVWEGGIRVPAIVRWPGRIPAGKVSDQVGITMDLTASILAVAGATVPAEARLEGMNLFPVWEGKAPEVERTLYWRAKQANRSQRAVRRGDWKVVDDAGHTYVFNLRTDPSERHDLANRRRDVAQALWPLLTAWEADVDAEAAALGATPPSGGR
ncbi:MAG TPA: sulfatase-like hydrolase/transferase [Gammaproteobacteria bacterium]|nr:sulfatase-like hydrolase/transferase [Gammaproteobacteria bacterium]